MGSKRLSDAVSEVIDRVVSGEVLNTRTAAVEIWDDIDEDGQYMAGIDGLVARISNKARTVSVATAVRRSAAEPELPFGLPAVVALDTEGHSLLPTRGLSRSEFIRAIDIREKQIRDDQARLSEWKTALKAADRFWRRHPDWSFGDCLDAIMGVSA